ncbi:MAG: PAS domain S-box protein [Nitrospira sp.]|nr:PAS domain S-box protein [Nitrospira sp.]
MPGKHSLIRDIFIRLVLAVSIPIILLGSLSYVYISSKTAENIGTKNELLANAVSGDIRGVLGEPYTILRELVTILSTYGHDDYEINRYLDATVKNTGYFESILLLDEKGMVLNYGLSENLSVRRDDFLGMDLSGLKHFQEATYKGKAIWSDIFLSPLTGQTSLSVSIRYGNNVLMGSFSIEHLHEFTKRFNEGENIITSIVDRRGVLIFHPDKSILEQHLNFSNILPLRLGMKGSYDTHPYDFNGVKYIGSVSAVTETGWTVLISQKYENAYAPLTRLRNMFTAVMLSMLVIVALIARVVSRSITRPLMHLRDSARLIAGGQYEMSIPEQEHSDMEELASGFRNMALAIKAREEQLKINEEKFRTLVESVKIVPWKMNVENMKYTYMGQQVEELTGYPADTWTDLEIWKERIAEEDREEAVVNCSSAMKTGADHEFEYRMRTVDGRVIWVRDIVSVISGDNRSREIAGFMIDITVQKESEEAVRLSAEKFSKAFSLSPVFMIISSLEEGRFLDVNNAFLQSSGYTREEVIGRTALELGTWVDLADRAMVVETLKREGVIRNFESSMRNRSGQVMQVLFSAELIEIDGQQYILAVTLDISEHKKLQDELMHSQKMEAVGQLAGGVAHEFNNILTAIINNAFLLKKKTPEGSETLSRINKIQELSESAARIAGELLTFSRKQALALIPINLNQTIRNIETLLKDFIEENIDFRIRLTDGEPVILADRSQIEQILVNLATNARDAMPDGGTLSIITESVIIDDDFISANGFGRPGKYALLIVSDTGTGIDEDIQQKIFDPFFTTKEIGKGTGLGLSIIYGIIEQHKGFIELSSKADEGAEFRIYLPEIKGLVEVASYEETTVSEGKSETILLAEDEISVRDSVRMLLEEYGYKVIEAVDGHEAFDIFQKRAEEIDLVILDVIMPRMNGKETFDAIKNIRPDVKVIFTSGYSMDLVKDRGLAGVNIPFISKPVSPEELLAKIRNVLNG